METTSGKSTGVPVRGPAAFPRPRRSGYRTLALGTLAVCVLLTAYFLTVTSGTQVPAATQLGRWYGLAGALLFTFGALYSVRHPVYRKRAGSLEWWYRAHLVLGVVALVLLGCHSGIRVRSGFLALLQVGFWGTVLTGVGGWGWQTFLRRWLLRNEWRPLVLKELEREREALLRRLAPAEGATEATDRDRAVQEAQRGLEQLRTGLLWRFPSALTWDGEATRLLGEAGLQALSAADRKLLLEWHRLEIQRAYQHLLRGWTHFHLIFTVAGVQLMLWHIWMVSLFPR
jgi:hypothetical protein